MNGNLICLPHIPAYTRTFNFFSVILLNSRITWGIGIYNRDRLNHPKTLIIIVPTTQPVNNFFKQRPARCQNPRTMPKVPMLLATTTNQTNGRGPEALAKLLLMLTAVYRDKRIFSTGCASKWRQKMMLRTKTAHSFLQPKTQRWMTVSMRRRTGGSVKKRYVSGDPCPTTKRFNPDDPNNWQAQGWLIPFVYQAREFQAVLEEAEQWQEDRDGGCVGIATCESARAYACIYIKFHIEQSLRIWEVLNVEMLSMVLRLKSRHFKIVADMQREFWASRQHRHCISNHQIC